MTQIISELELNVSVKQIYAVMITFLEAVQPGERPGYNISPIS